MVELQNNIQTYKAYKDSGVAWLGEIPEHWELGRLGSILNPVSSKNHPNETLLSITREKGVIVRDLENEDENHNYIPDDLTGYKLLKKGQFGMNKMKAWQGSYGVSEYTGIVSPAYYTFEFSKDIEPRFFHLAIRSKMYVSFFGQASDGVRIGQWDLSKDRMKRIPMAIPPLKEQTQIAHFLDNKTTKIDDAIAIKEQQIALLKERKQILIHKAVTRGLDDNVKLKYSGVEWIGEIPEHWEVRRFKFLCDITTGSKNTEDKVDNGLYPFYVRSQKPEKINSCTFEGEAILTAGDGAGVGKVFHYVNEKFDFHQRVYKFSNFKSIKGKLLFYFLRSNFHSVALNGEAKSTVDSLRLPLIQNFMVTIPPTIEQLEIIEKIETASQKIETAISLKQQEISKLQEYKSSLINSVVTGKVKVC
jgi:type I restriction enzyme S subunit